MIKALCKESVESILKNPERFIDANFDKPIVEIYFSDDTEFPVTLMIGRDDVTDEFYIVLEDETHSADIYLGEGETLESTYNNIIEICKSGKLCF